MKEIDATNKKLGRIAQQAAMILMGKDEVDYEPNKINTNGVHIVNVSKAIIDEKKKGEKEYEWFTGHPSGLKKIKMGDLIKKKGLKEVFENAVYGMIPNNRLRKQRMK